MEKQKISNKMKKIKVNDDWYIAELLEKCEPIGKDKNNPNRRCTVWRNALLINADSIEEAYDKAFAIGKSETRLRYKAASGDTVQWSFLGIADLLPIYEDIQDGNELFWTNHGQISVKRAKAMAKPKKELIKNVT
jgi:hypothetical protein